MTCNKGQEERTRRAPQPSVREPSLTLIPPFRAGGEAPRLCYRRHTLDSEQEGVQIHFYLLLHLYAKEKKKHTYSSTECQKCLTT